MAVPDPDTQVRRRPCQALCGRSVTTRRCASAKQRSQQARRSLFPPVTLARLSTSRGVVRIRPASQAVAPADPPGLNTALCLFRPVNAIARGRKGPPARRARPRASRARSPSSLPGDRAGSSNREYGAMRPVTVFGLTPSNGRFDLLFLLAHVRHNR